MKSDFLFYTKERQLFCSTQNTQLKTRYWKTSLSETAKNTGNMASGSGSNGFYRPRSALARALYEKQSNDRHLQELDHNEVSYLRLTICNN